MISLPRHSAGLLAIGVIVAGLIWSASTVRGQTSAQPIADGGPDLQTTLEKGLKARRPVEFAFIAQVIQLVDDGTLPENMVLTSFLWARKHRPYPYPYFAASLRRQAATLGVSL